MKKLIFFILSIIIAQTVNAQQKYLVDEYGNTMHYSVARKYSKFNLFLLVDSGTKQVTPFEFLSNLPFGNVVLLKGAKTIELETRIQKDSLSFYRYSIIENDTVIIKKDAVPDRIKYKWDKGNPLQNYVSVDLGILNVVNKKIEVRIFRIDNKNKVTSVIIYNKPILPASLLSFTIQRTNTAQNLNKDTILTVDEKIKGLRVTMKNTDINILYAIAIENIDGHSISMLEPKWKRITGTDVVIADINVKDFEKPGKYKISVYPKINTYAYWKDNSLSKDFPFKVEKPKENILSDKQSIINGLIIGGIVGIMSVLILSYNKKRAAKKLAQQAKEKEIAKLQLNSVRSQLNPHFLFNALAGIQNLMNKNEIDNANRYLSKFARLTRNVLNSKELISLTEEKTLLDDYLQMEQLRFGFQYKLSASAELDTENIEIPAMLLQPFVENAVKHGIAEKGNEGKIEIAFEKHLSNLVLKISDNGKGFNTTQTYNGLGLELSKNRISLLNTIYKETPFTLDINSNENGTHITITLTQWI